MPNIRRTPPKSTNTTEPLNILHFQSEPDIQKALSNSPDVSNTRQKRPRRGSPTDSNPVETDSAILLSEMRLLSQQISDLRQQNMDIGAKLSLVSDTLNQKLELLNKKICNKDSEIVLLKESVTELQTKLCSYEQTDMKSELEIMGIPEESNENLIHITMLTARKIGIQLSETDIDEVYRTGKRRTNMTGKPRSIVLRLTRRILRTQILKAAKVRRPLSSEDIIKGSAINVYINERLSRSNKELFREARARAAEYSFRYCWVRNSTIYVRKAENLPAMPVRTPRDLDEKIGLHGSAAREVSQRSEITVLSQTVDFHEG